SNPRIAQQYRLNIGTIVEAPELNVRLTRGGKGGNARAGRVLGRIEEYFLETLTQSDTSLFAGKVLRFEGIRENECIASNAAGQDAKIPVYAGGKLPLSTYLASQVRAMLADRTRWQFLPEQVREWLEVQQWKSVLPATDEPLIETFPPRRRFDMVP